MTLVLGKAAAPFVMALFAWAVCAPARRLVERHMQDGRLKRLLLKKVN